MNVKALSLISLLAFSFCGLAEQQYRFSGIPAVGFDPDSGFGGGAVGNFYIDENDFKPYKMSTEAQLFVTTKGVHSHALRIDRIKAFNLPWRLMGQVGFYKSIAQNYCGKGSRADCSESRATTRADGLNLLKDSDARKDFMSHFYKNRYMAFYGGIFSRWLLWQEEAKLELTSSYRGKYYVAGDFKHRGPYANSLYAEHYKNQRTDGYLSLLEVGLMLDKRDNEPAPTKGYWLESSMRGGAKIIGSAWNFFGFNLAARFYVPLDDQRKLVFASQSMLDATFGNLPFDAVSNIGGSQAFRDYNAFGGQYLGRGIREQMYVGHFKAIEQLEMRYKFYSFHLWKQKFDLALAMLGDLAMTSWDFSTFKYDMRKVLAGFGGGLRVHWNDTFVIRVDLAMSPHENFALSPYLVLGHVF